MDVAILTAIIAGTTLIALLAAHGTILVVKFAKVEQKLDDMRATSNSRFTSQSARIKTIEEDVKELMRMNGRS